VGKVEEEYCWAITQMALGARCGRSGFIVSEFGFEMYCLVYTYIHIYLATCALSFDLPQKSMFAGPSMK